MDMYKVTENIFPIEWRMSDALKVPKHNCKVFGSFVCGGGSTMGYKLSGYDHLGGVEFTEHYSKVYKANHNPKYFYIEDIRRFNERNDLPAELYDLDLLDGSPPCAAFSTSGAREKLWGKTSEYEGKQQVKDDLVYVYCDTIEKLMPKVFILENVSGLMKGNAKSYLKNVVNRLSGKYNVQVFLLYAASMGIPQIRNRVFVIGQRKDLNLPKLKLEFDCPQLGFGVTKKYWGNGGDSIERYAIGSKWDEIAPGESHPVRFSLKKPHPQKPCFVIQESDSNASTPGVCHPYQKRKLNVDEVRMLCTFPIDYNFLDINPVSVMGRSVLPVMMANISHQIYLQWLSKVITKEVV
jgi:DNA (cytosine-5)-methyltransferase 1